MKIEILRHKAGLYALEQVLSVETNDQVSWFMYQLHCCAWIFIFRHSNKSNCKRSNSLGREVHKATQMKIEILRHKAGLYALEQVLSVETNDQVSQFMYQLHCCAWIFIFRHSNSSNGWNRKAV
jgi:hypothetical protein